MVLSELYYCFNIYIVRVLNTFVMFSW